MLIYSLMLWFDVLCAQTELGTCPCLGQAPKDLQLPQLRSPEVYESWSGPYATLKFWAASEGVWPCFEWVERSGWLGFCGFARAF